MTNKWNDPDERLHLIGTHPASIITIADASGNYDETSVEGALNSLRVFTMGPTSGYYTIQPLIPFVDAQPAAASGRCYACPVIPTHTTTISKIVCPVTAAAGSGYFCVYDSLGGSSGDPLNVIGRSQIQNISTTNYEYPLTGSVILSGGVLYYLTAQFSSATTATKGPHACFATFGPKLCYWTQTGGSWTFVENPRTSALTLASVPAMWAR